MSDELDRLLRDTLESEALSYEPRGDGLTKIRSRITARRARRRWLVPSLAMAAVAAAVAGVIVIPGLLPDRHSSAPTPGHSTAPTPSGSPAPSTSPSTTASPLPDFATLWPYQSRSAAAASEPADVASGRRPYLTDAKQTALRFVSDYLGFNDPLEVIRTQPMEAGVGVVLGNRNPNNQLYQITTIYLVRVQKADTSPYVVARADAPMLRLTDVSPGQAGIVVASGTVGGPHEAVLVRLLTANAREAAAGNDGSVGALFPWRVVLGSKTKPVPPGRYAVVVRTLSDANSLLSELTVRAYDAH